MRWNLWKIFILIILGSENTADILYWRFHILTHKTLWVSSVNCKNLISQAWPSSFLRDWVSRENCSFPGANNLRPPGKLQFPITRNIFDKLKETTFWGNFHKWWDMEIQASIKDRSYYDPPSMSIWICKCLSIAPCWVAAPKYENYPVE